MLKEMVEIRSNSVRGRYDRAIAAMKDTSGFVTERVPSLYVEPVQEERGVGAAVGLRSIEKAS